MYVNDRGAYTVLEAAVGAGARKVIFGSSKEAMNTDYGQDDTRPRYFPIDEEHPAQPRNDYGISKLINEITCQRYTESYGLQTICLRINHNWYLDRGRGGRRGAVGLEPRAHGGRAVGGIPALHHRHGQGPLKSVDGHRRTLTRRERSGWLWRTNRSGTRSS